MKIKLKSVRNIRDFSEYGSKNIRSAHLNGLSAEEGEILKEKYGVKTVIDLRTYREVAEKPDNIPIGVEYIHIPIFEDSVPGITHESRSNAPEDFKRTIPNMPKMYYSIATDEPYISRVKSIMSLICEKSREGAVLWHCTEGKDRCGILSALYLLSLGVDREEVIKDYLRSRKANLFKAWKYYFLLILARQGVGFAKSVRDAFCAKRSYIEPIMDILTDISAEYKDLVGDARK